MIFLSLFKFKQILKKRFLSPPFLKILRASFFQSWRKIPNSSLFQKFSNCFFCACQSLSFFHFLCWSFFSQWIVVSNMATTNFNKKRCKRKVPHHIFLKNIFIKQQCSPPLTLFQALLIHQKNFKKKTKMSKGLLQNTSVKVGLGVVAGVIAIPHVRAIAQGRTLVGNYHFARFQ